MKSFAVSRNPTRALFSNKSRTYPSVPNHRQRLSPFVLSLSKYERTLQAVNGLFKS
ncbi:MAG: hypothetical protein LBD67_04770 [Candidatus Accumulibacter sp.]|nr:hypothetical protein [Accumulibacter sp.]